MGASKKLKESLDEAVATAQSCVTRAENGESVESALLSIQLGLKAPKDNVNNFAHFNYRTAGQILEKVKPFLAETGCVLCVDDDLCVIGDRYYVHSTVTLHHIASGGEIVSNGYAREGLTEKGKMDSQMTGSASTFAKKYALCNLFCIDDSEEDPDTRSGKEPELRETEAIDAFLRAQSIEELKTLKARYINEVKAFKSVNEAAMTAYNEIQMASKL